VRVAALVIALASIAGVTFGASSASVAASVQPPDTAQPAATTTAQSTDTAPRPSFAEFLQGIRDEALSRGIRKDIVDAALSNIEEPLPIVIERDRAQAETVLPLERYIAQRLTAKRVRTGREMMARHRSLLTRVADRYGVPARIIVAIWGVESEYGRLTGIRPTIQALATLAWDPRRSTLFRNELFRALEILNRGDIDFAHLRGSWAGAMGQAQFMPSSYLQYAEDFDGDGRKDIWTTLDDVFASIGNYLNGHGWERGETWGREVKLTKAVAERIVDEVPRREGGCRATREMTIALPLKEWQALGVRLPGGAALPRSDVEASLISGQTRHFLAYQNYDALLEYNCANAYALGVALLGDRITGPAPKSAPAKATRKKPAPRKR
jgi:membrane-bound lytic murein transglycosylase B